ncbi:hypothetical protein LTR62_001707 [Meristemomyces frigidus]|uniref:Cell division cycle protein 123 n=1 Tax=Meristemomyces frigidus TaxID=1508187 RepID=A0AAN7TJJ7_9PEZI|nr:hypothetical protein LTR62_001707 [Meristemomyces frigidus]
MDSHPPSDSESDSDDETTTPQTLAFPPVTRQHILNCSYHSWYPKYKPITPKSRLIPLTSPFLDYLRADSIILPDDDVDQQQQTEWDSDSGIFSKDEDEASDDDDVDILSGWHDLHATIGATIAELGGKVMPKLNWSAPKDATWMNANTMECRTPNEIYLLLKSSDFVTHDLEHAFDDTEALAEQRKAEDIPFHLVLRKSFQMNPSMEFRCFVRGRKLLALCQRDLNHFDFLAPMQHKLSSLIQQFFDVRLRDSFEDENFVFDCYVPAPYTRVWLVDVNPWAPRTDPLLFSWMEILGIPEPMGGGEDEEDLSREEVEGEFVRLKMADPTKDPRVAEALRLAREDAAKDALLDIASLSSMSEDDEVEEDFSGLPELRLVGKNDPEAWSFNTPKYSAHKLPRDVVDASQSGEGLREFAREWEAVLEKRRREDVEGGSSGEE